MREIKKKSPGDGALDGSAAEKEGISFASHPTTSPRRSWLRRRRRSTPRPPAHAASWTMVRAGGRGGLSAADTESDGCAGTGLEGARPEVRGIQPHAQRTRVGEAPSDTAGAEGGGETSATTRAGYAERVGDGRTDLGCFRSDGRACRMA